MHLKGCNSFLSYLILGSIILFAAQKIPAQWSLVGNYDVGDNGRMAIHDSTVFLYGYILEQFVYRSTDNGDNWTNITDKFPQNDTVNFIHSMENEIFGVIGTNQIYSSTDDGVTWNLKSTVPQPTGSTNYAIINLTSDGNILYALTNRASVFKSTDSGSSWAEIYINYTQSQLQGRDFAAIGSKMVFIPEFLGSFISTDGGANWSLKYSANTISGGAFYSVHPFKDEFYASSDGVYKLVADTGWAPFNNGLPITGFDETKCEISNSQNIFTYFSVIFGDSKIFSSSDNGNNWSEAGSNLPTGTTGAINDFMAATDNYLYCYLSSLGSMKGVYRLKLQTATGLENNNLTVPANFALLQNYPNPFNPSTKITFQVPKSSYVSLKIYDMLGKEVANPINKNLSAGTYNYTFNAANLTSGIYLYRISSNGFVETKKMILMK